MERGRKVLDSALDGGDGDGGDDGDDDVGDDDDDLQRRSFQIPFRSL